MEKAQKSKWFLWTGLIIGFIIIAIGYISYKQTGKVDYKEVGALVVSGFALFGIIIGAAFSSKATTNVSEMKKDISLIKSDHLVMKKGLDEVNENFRHRKQIMSLCQQIENETSQIFDRYSDVNSMLKDYIISVNDEISNVIEKQYSYDLDLFDPKTFKRLIMAKVHQVEEHVNFVMINKQTFEVISNKVDSNINKYIIELKQIKGMENGSRRKEFGIQTLELTKKITNHSIDIYKTKKETA